MIYWRCIRNKHELFGRMDVLMFDMMKSDEARHSSSSSSHYCTFILSRSLFSSSSSVSFLLLLSGGLQALTVSLTLYSFFFLFPSLKLIQLSPVFCLCFYPRTEMTWDNLGSAPLSIDSPTDQNRIKEDVLVISFNSTHLYHPITGLSWRKLWSDKIYSLQTQKLEEWTRPQ